MIARSKMMAPTRDESAEEKPLGQSRPKEERYMLRVDNQAKRSFDSKESAMTAGDVIKKAFPIVMVSVFDSKDGSVEIVK